MGFFDQVGFWRGWGIAGVVAVGFCGAGTAGAARLKSDPWASAVKARMVFEAEPQGQHTRVEYARVMDGFRAIYHGDPGDVHAAKAVEQVAELLAEQGRELGDKKSLRDAAGQYEYLAKAYPGGELAPVALGQALDLLGSSGADDRVEAVKVRAELENDYPRSGAARAARASAGVEGKRSLSKRAEVVRPTSQNRDMGYPGSAKPEESEVVQPGSENPDPGHPASAGVEGRRSLSKRAEVVQPTSQNRDMRHPGSAKPEESEVVQPGSENPDPGHPASAGVRPTSQNRDMGHPASEVIQPTSQNRDVGNAGVVAASDAGPVAIVSGIRHWSTANYTRVAIDLGADVKYEAARVENPDRIFFDLHHARLGPQLVGKSFAVTDDGFLTRIRAAQFSDDVTRVVLDVHQVTEYSAFLLPNPYRLIIDIHGKRDGAQGSGSRAQGPENGSDPAPVVRLAPAGGSVEVSSLPPMPVTDGNGSFGLPAKAEDRGAGGRSAVRSRVVVSSKPTEARPVPNTVATHSSETGTEVAAVSSQPGVVEATRKPTSRPIAAKSEGAGGGGPGPRAQGPGLRAQGPEGGSADDGGYAAVVAARKAHKSDGGKAAPVEAAAPTADGETLVRALGLKIGRIVIDAGHGGHDSGTLGVGGIEEKDVVLDVALRLGKLLHDRLGAEVVYTRADDTFVPLETRTAIANKAQADLFISIHANSSTDADARGVEVYYLNFTSDPDAMRVAARENAVSTQSVHELSDLVKKIALKDKIDESKELATDVDESLYTGLESGNEGLKDRGVKKAPFVVLIGANMPSILAEISFVTNPVDAAELRTKAYRQRVAESLYRGIAKYAEGVNGVGTERAAR